MHTYAGKYARSNGAPETAGPGVPHHPRPATVTTSGRRPVSHAGNPIRIVLIEDNRLACGQLATLLARQPSFRVVATATCAAAGLTHIQTTKPHVALVDAGLGDPDSQACLERAREAAPGTRMIMMDVLPGKADVLGLIRAGASGFILKDATVDVVVDTIQSVAHGTAVAPAPLTSVLWSQLAVRSTAPTPPKAPRATTPLTKREQEIVDLIIDGYANKEISQRLSITIHTVKSHIHSILEKLGLRSRLEIAAHARRP